MITKFSVLYVGQIELENVGLQGTPANDRRYGNERLAEAFHTAKDVAQHMDELGYYCLWTAEHHFQHGSSSAARSTCCRCGTPSASPRTTRPPTS